jgi:hypothetical protein
MCVAPAFRQKFGNRLQGFRIFFANFYLETNRSILDLWQVCFIQCDQMSLWKLAQNAVQTFFG